MTASSILQAGTTESFEDERAFLRYNFLKREGLEKESLIPLPVDASKRCYFRLPQALLMDAPPPFEKTVSFQFIAELLNQAGLSVPRIYASDHTYGFLLVEDFGLLTYRNAIQGGIAEHLLYGETIKSLVHLHQQVIENKTHFPLYDLDSFLKEAEVFIEWYGLSLSEKEGESFREVWAEAYESQPVVPHSFVMRDVLVDNLMWIPSRQGFNRCGFIDFQDGTHEGIWGPITYDLVSLLEDARRDITPQFAENMMEIYFKAFPDLSREDFWASYALWGAQRSTKILGVFSRLAKRDGKLKYLTHLPRVWQILKRDLQHPSLRPIRKWFANYCGEEWQKMDPMCNVQAFVQSANDSLALTEKNG
ncbi:MAG: phosphotransferase [Alphaproteobacteria bacterium]|jgi:aminoglycoside/choline kinase family phosphotransferase|nr:phosphotransferase [Alphaproteobacteria bacterium]MBP7729064.1 phosphotransferase [Alphaproteobacteria bacterium]